jgi:hypothetical protein
MRLSDTIFIRAAPERFFAFFDEMDDRYNVDVGSATRSGVIWLRVGDSRSPCSACSSDEAGVSPLWQFSAAEALSESTIALSFPHRSSRDRDEIVQGFLGRPWQDVYRRFGIDRSALPDTLSEVAEQPA